MADLFSDIRPAQAWHGDGVLHLPGFARDLDLSSDLSRLVAASPFRHMKTPGGRAMSAAMTNCGACGWVSDKRGYRYSDHDPMTGQPWPDMPVHWRELACQAATAFGAPDFKPDACLVNRYGPGARMALHQDRDEADLCHPVVSLSFGATGEFMLGGLQRRDKPEIIRLEHGDGLIFGRAARLVYHGIKPIRAGQVSPLGEDRYNLTFRQAF